MTRYDWQYDLIFTWKNKSYGYLIMLVMDTLSFKVGP